jgi:hypothetical protein
MVMIVIVRLEDGNSNEEFTRESGFSAQGEEVSAIGHSANRAEAEKTLVRSD